MNKINNHEIKIRIYRNKKKYLKYKNIFPAKLTKHQNFGLKFKNYRKNNDLLNNKIF